MLLLLRPLAREAAEAPVLRALRGESEAWVQT